MSDESVTLRLGGSVTVDDFVARATSWLGILRSITDEAGLGSHVTWQLAGLDYGSAIVTAEPLPDSPEVARVLPRLVSDYLDSARAVRDGFPSDGRRSLRLVRELAAEATPDSEITFETPEAEVIFIGGTKAAAEVVAPESAAALGTVRGRIETVSQRGRLRFTLYDLTSDRAVICYVEPDKEELLRNVWGHLADVTGLVSRDPRTDRALSVRRVTSIDLVREPTTQAFLRARGAVPALPDALPSEELIRIVRDAG